MPQDEEVITTTAAERRVGGALMWMGALLGAAFIAAIGLGFLLYNASYSESGPVKTLTKENKELSAKVEAQEQTLQTTQQALKDEKTLNATLQAANDKLTHKKPVSAPPPVDPFK
jgi:hypothetical protein